MSYPVWGSEALVRINYTSLRNITLHRAHRRPCEARRQLGHGILPQLTAASDMASPPTTRRIITGHNADGKAIFESDEVLTTVNPFTNDGSAPPAGSMIPGFTLVGLLTADPVVS
jgi:hypothetical protein